MSKKNDGAGLNSRLIRRPIQRWAPLFILPVFAAFCIGFVWPFLQGIYLSFCTFNIPKDAKWVGLTNYSKIWTDVSFWNAFKNTAFFAVVSILLINVLLLMVEVTKQANKRLNAAKNKLVPTKEELFPNTKFVENRFIAQLEVNKQLLEFSNNQKKTWENEADFVKTLCDKILESDIYKEYMASETSSYEEDRELWRKLYKNIIFNNIELDQVLEDQSLYWNDDKEIVDTFVLKTIKRFDEKNGAKQELLPEFKDEEDQDFARRLFRRTILNADYYRHLISENTKNWDLDRVAFMDVVIMQIALAEILSFPNIPVSVSLNEYVEIAKLYSTPKSGGFINGTLDGIVNSLKKENKLTKN